MVEAAGLEPATFGFRIAVSEHVHVTATRARSSNEAQRSTKLSYVPTVQRKRQSASGSV